MLANCSLFEKIEGFKAKTKEERKVESKLLERIIVFPQHSVLALELARCYLVYFHLDQKTR